MQTSSLLLSLLSGLTLTACSLGPLEQLTSKQLALSNTVPKQAVLGSEDIPSCQSQRQKPNFLVVGGGGAPWFNEIAIEKNVLYFQRTLRALKFDPAQATIFFANGNNGQATVRYLDNQGQEQFKVPEIPHVAGASTLTNIQRWIGQTAQQQKQRPLFFYFTGHGYLNRSNRDNNAMILWQQKLLNVQQFSRLLDQMPQETPVVALMVQCYSGSFANFIYKDGDPKRPLTLQTRCGFFATIKHLPSVGCTPEVNEADYQDYSSSFFAGLSGRSRTGQPVASADYNQDGRVSFAEAHAFAKIDERSPDLPISTSEAWLQEQVSDAQADAILKQPMSQWSQNARPEQVAVVTTLAQRLKFNLAKSVVENRNQFKLETRSEEERAYLGRLSMELINIATEKRIRNAAKNNASQLAILERLLRCESNSMTFEQLKTFPHPPKSRVY